MLVALLVAACVARAAPEWVEISQHHAHPALHPPPSHRAPTRHRGNIRQTTQNPVRPHPPYIDDEPRLPNIHEDPTIYPNHSISEYSWNRNHQASGNIKRFNTHFKRANITPEFSLEIYEEVTEIEPELVTRNVAKDKESVSATIERVSNKGSVKRVQLSTTPVKSPSVTNGVRTVSPTRRNDIGKFATAETDDGFSDEFEIKSDIFKDEQKELITKIPLSHVKHISVGTKVTPVNHDRIITSMDMPTSEPSNSLHRFPHKFPQEHAHKFDISEDTSDERDPSTYNSPTQSDKNILATKKSPSSGVETAAKIKPLENTNKNLEKIVSQTPNIDTTKNNVPEHIFQDLSNSDDLKSNEKHPVDMKAPFLQNETKQRNNNTNGSANKIDDVNKMNTMGNVMEFMKVVADTISKNTRRGVSGKVEYLNELKDTLLCSIKDRIDATWPDETSAPARRRSRSATARGHVEFPSSESSLMTISFLTFAVFLIKLVLQVIHTYKNKAMMVAPLVVATGGRTFRKLRKFH